MKQQKPRFRGEHPVLSLTVIAGDATIFKCKQKQLKDVRDLREILEAVGKKL